MCAARTPTVQRRRVAVTIGNNDYPTRPLRNCINDATDLSKKLEEIGFNVTARTNLNSAEMHGKIEEFVASIEPGDFVLFFFAGHGTQWEDQNYLIPCDYDQNYGAPDLKHQATNAQRVLEWLSSKNPFVIVFLLDCCRDYWQHNNARGFFTPKTPRGMAPMTAPVNSLIGFACAAGATAADVCASSRNGIFTSHLLQHIAKPGEEVIMLLVDVASGVVEETGGNQRPYTTSCFHERGICLVPPTTPGPTPMIRK